MGLDLEIFGQPVFLTGPDSLLKGRDLLLSVGAVAEIILSCLGQGHVSNPAPAVGCAVDRFIMQYNGHVILGETDICLNSVESQLGSQLKGSQRILRRVLGGASVGHLIVAGGFVETCILSKCGKGFTVAKARFRGYFDQGRHCFQFRGCQVLLIGFPDCHKGVHAFGNDHTGAVGAQGLLGVDIPEDQLISLLHADQIPFSEMHDHLRGSFATFQFPVSGFTDDRFFRNIGSVDPSDVKVFSSDIAA